MSNEQIPAVPKRGRPRKFAPWFAAVANTMANGTTLRTALRLNNLTLEDSEMRLLYKNLEFRKMYRVERHLFMYNQFGKRPQTELERIRKNLARQIS